MVARLVERVDPLAAFLYIPVDHIPEIQDYQYAVLDGFDADRVELKPVEPENLHITLLYIDKIKEDELEQLFNDVNEVMPVAFQVEVSHTGTFPEAEDKPVVLHISPSPSLMRLQNELYNAAFSMGLPLSIFSRPENFKPHISVAYDMEPPDMPIPDLPAPVRIPIDHFVASRPEYERLRTVYLPTIDLESVLVEQADGPNPEGAPPPAPPRRIGGSIPDGATTDAEDRRNLQDAVERPVGPEKPLSIRILYDPYLEKEAQSVNTFDTFDITIGPAYYEAGDEERAGILARSLGQDLARRLLLGAGGAHEWQRADAMMAAPPEDVGFGFRYVFANNSLQDAIADTYAVLSINPSEIGQRGYWDASDWIGMAVTEQPQFEPAQLPDIRDLVSRIGEEDYKPGVTLILDEREKDKPTLEELQDDLDEYEDEGMATGTAEAGEEFGVSKSDLLHMLRGGSLTYGPLRRVLTLEDGPFLMIEDGQPVERIAPMKLEPEEIAPEPEPEPEIVIIEPSLRERIRDVLKSFTDQFVRIIARGGEGSGHFGHEGREGKVGGSKPSSKADASKPDKGGGVSVATSGEAKKARSAGFNKKRAKRENARWLKWETPKEFVDTNRARITKLGDNAFLAEIRYHVNWGDATTFAKETLPDIESALEWANEHLSDRYEGAVERGGEGSGHHGHEGRPGEVGGSKPSSGGKAEEPKAGPTPDDPRLNIPLKEDGRPARLPEDTTEEFLRRQREFQEARLEIAQAETARKQALRAEMVAEFHARVEAGLENPLEMNRQEYELLAWADTGGKMIVQKPDEETDEVYLMWQEQYLRDKFWMMKMSQAVGRGDITPQDASDQGWRHGPVTYDEPGGWVDLPEKLWHVTTAGTAVQEEGLKTRVELSDGSGNGLGGGTDEAISFTDDPVVAEYIYHAIVEGQQVARGEKTVQDMIDEATAGEGGANRPYLKLWMGHYNSSWEEGDALPAGVQDTMRGVRSKSGGFNTLEEVIADTGEDWRPHRDATVNYKTDGTPMYSKYEIDLTPEEQLDANFSLFKHFSTWRQFAGGYEDPLFFSSDPSGLASVPTEEIQILEFDGTGVGYQKAALGEWRAPSGEAVDFSRVVEPSGHRLTRDEIIASINRERERRGMEPLDALETIDRADILDPISGTAFYTLGASGPGLDDESGIIKAIATDPSVVASGVRIMVDSGDLRGIWRVKDGGIVRREDVENTQMRLVKFFDAIEDLSSVTFNNTDFLRREDLDLVERGGEGSGHHDHKGRPGEVGGSLPSGKAEETPTPDAGARLEVSVPDYPTVEHIAVHLIDEGLSERLTPVIEQWKEAMGGLPAKVRLITDDKEAAIEYLVQLERAHDASRGNHEWDEPEKWETREDYEDALRRRLRLQMDRISGGNVPANWNDDIIVYIDAEKTTSDFKYTDRFGNERTAKVGEGEAEFVLAHELAHPVVSSVGTSKFIVALFEAGLPDRPPDSYFSQMNDLYKDGSQTNREYYTDMIGFAIRREIDPEETRISIGGERNYGVEDFPEAVEVSKVILEVARQGIAEQEQDDFQSDAAEYILSLEQRAASASTAVPVLFTFDRREGTEFFEVLPVPVDDVPEGAEVFEGFKNDATNKPRSPAVQRSGWRAFMNRVVEVIGPLRRIFITEGGEGSGHHGHEGRPGEVGGSKPGDGDSEDYKAKIDSRVSSMLMNQTDRVSGAAIMLEAWDRAKQYLDLRQGARREFEGRLLDKVMKILNQELPDPELNWYADQGVFATYEDLLDQGLIDDNGIAETSFIIEGVKISKGQQTPFTYPGLTIDDVPRPIEIRGDKVFPEFQYGDEVTYTKWSGTRLKGRITSDAGTKDDRITYGFEREGDDPDEGEHDREPDSYWGHEDQFTLRALVERGGKGSGHHGHRGREGEVGGSEPGPGGPKKGKGRPPGPKRPEPKQKQDIDEPEPEVEAEPLTPDWEVYGVMEGGGEEQFGFNEDLSITEQIPLDVRRAFLASLPHEDTRTMTVAQRLDLSKVFMDMDRDQFNEMYATHKKLVTGLFRSNDADDIRQRDQLGGITDVMFATGKYLATMEAARQNLTSDDDRTVQLGENLIRNATSRYNSGVIGLHKWPEEDRNRFYKESTDTYQSTKEDIDLYAFVSGGSEEAPVEVKGALRTITNRGGKGSGHFEHAGREGKVGGSEPSGGKGGVKTKPAPRGQTEPPPPPADLEFEGSIVKKIGDVDIPFDSEEQFQQIKALAEDHVGVAEQSEPELTQMMMLLAEQHGGQMEKIEHATKSVNSMIRKIRLDMISEGLDADTAGALINDVNRYTMVFEPSEFTERVLAVQDTLKEQGWEMYDNKWKNFFQTGDAYDGYNTVMWNPDTGQKYELQYHTTQSIQIKDRAHDMFTKLKALGPDQRSERISLWSQMTALWQEGADYMKPDNWWLLPGVMK
jgi:2'-5' RNA ligase